MRALSQRARVLGGEWVLFHFPLFAGRRLIGSE